MLNCYPNYLMSYSQNKKENILSNRKIISSFIDQPTIRVPGSKYLANRYIALAALAKGSTKLLNVPLNDDILTALKAIEVLGADVIIDGDSVYVEGIENFECQKSAIINCNDSGTLSRFITAVAANLSTPITIDASEQMRQRPMQEIVDALKQLGVQVESNDGYFPISLQGPIEGGSCKLDASRSSQFLSGLLIASLKAKNETLLQLVGELVSESYIELTLSAIKRFSGEVERLNEREFLIRPQQNVVATSIEVASDVVSCSYFMAAALIAETGIRIRNYDFNSLQGEAQFPKVLQLLGASVEHDGDDLLIAYQKTLQGIEVDMGNMPDVVPTLTVIAAFASGPTKITNIAHLAYKESNRIGDLCEQLKKAGVSCEYDDSSITVFGEAMIRPERVSSCHDHRLAMSLALLGIKCPGLIVEDAQAVEKSFPLYWQYLEDIGIKSKDI